MDAQSWQPFLKEDVERVKVGSHEGMVHLEESQVGWSIEEVRKADEGFGGIHIQEEDGSQEGHALDIAYIWSVAGIGPQDVMKRLIVRSALIWGGGGGGGGWIKPCNAGCFLQ